MKTTGVVVGSLAALFTMSVAAAFDDFPSDWPARLDAISCSALDGGYARKPSKVAVIEGQLDANPDLLSLFHLTGLPDLRAPNVLLEWKNATHLELAIHSSHGKHRFAAPNARCAGGTLVSIVHSQTHDESGRVIQDLENHYYMTETGSLAVREDARSSRRSLFFFKTSRRTVIWYLFAPAANQADSLDGRR